MTGGQQFFLTIFKSPLSSFPVYLNGHAEWQIHFNYKNDISQRFEENL